MVFQGWALREREKKRLALGVLLTVAFALGGCSSQIADLTPADTQPRPRDSSGYLPVHDVPPARDEAVISPEQRAKIEAELTAARDRQATAAKDAK